MTIKELIGELNVLVEAGYGDAKAVVKVPTLFVTEDGDIGTNDYRNKTENIYFSAEACIKDKKDLAQFFIENKDCLDKDGIDKELNEIQLHKACYDRCSCWDYYDDRKKCEGEECEDDDEEG